MSLFSLLGISFLSAFYSLFISHPLPKQVVFQTTEKKIHQIVLSPTPSIQFPSMSTMQKISPIPSSTPDQQKKTVMEKVFPLVQSSQLEFFISAINTYRTSLGLPAISINSNVCNFAKTRAQEISTNFSHDGFNQRVQSSTLPYSTYSLVTENIAQTPHYQDVINLWKHSPSHDKNLRSDTPYACVQNYGDYYVYEGWKE